MMSRRRSRRRSSDSRLVYTDIRVSPHVATSLMEKLFPIKEKLKFRIVPSQVHIDGKCEILAIKLDLTVADRFINEYITGQVKSFNGNKAGSDVSNCLEGVADSTVLDNTILVSDMDDSVCVLSPPASSDSLKRLIQHALSYKKVAENNHKDSPKQQKMSSPNCEESNAQNDASIVVLSNLDDSLQVLEPPLNEIPRKDVEVTLPSSSSTFSNESKTPEVPDKIAMYNSDTSLLEKVAHSVKSLISSKEQQSPSKSSTATSEDKANATIKTTCPNSNVAITSDSEDDIVIEREVHKKRKKTSRFQVKPVVLGDSDDDILVCEVVKPDSSNGGTKDLMKKSQPALDFIPLPNCPRSVTAPNFIPLTSKRRTKTVPTPDFIPLKRGPLQTLKCVQKQSKGKPIKQSPLAKRLAMRIEQRGKLSKKKDKKEKALKKSATQPKKGGRKGSDDDADSTDPQSLRPIIIDGNNVAVGHGRKEFSFKGLQICIKHFQDRGHKVVAILPKYRRFHVSPEDRQALDVLEKEGAVSFTPSRTMQDGRKVASYDDRFIVEAAHKLGAVIVSMDNFRDILDEHEEWRETIEQRLLMFTWVGDILMFPDDPLGRNGPKLKQFLRFPPEKTQ